jgi:hypothetical protein
MADGHSQRRLLTRFMLTCIGAFLFALVSGEVHSAPSVFPTGVTVYKPDKVQPGYTVYGVKGFDKVLVLNMEGEEIHSWTIPGLSQYIKPLSKGRILVFANSSGVSTEPDSDVIREYDWDGNLVWEFFLPEGFKNFHHDFQRLPNGNTLMISSMNRTALQISRQVRDNIILEVDKNKNIVWQWSTLDHFDQLGFSEETVNCLKNEFQGDDTFHTNSIQVLPPNRLEKTDARFKRGNILLSQRNLNHVFIIDKASGNVVWKCAVETIGQHHASMIPPNYHGAGNILLFDNGGNGGCPVLYRLFSKVLEINPVEQKIAWSYSGVKTEHRPVASFFSIYRSSAQRLRNGNTLIAESDWGRIVEVTPTGEILWEFVNPYFREFNKDIVTGYTNLIFRAYRVDANWKTGSSGAEYW